ASQELAPVFSNQLLAGHFQNQPPVAPQQAEALRRSHGIAAWRKGRRLKLRAPPEHAADHKNLRHQISRFRSDQISSRRFCLPSRCSSTTASTEVLSRNSHNRGWP